MDPQFLACSQPWIVELEANPMGGAPVPSTSRLISYDTIGMKLREEAGLMFKAWNASAHDGHLLARQLEAHLNEYAAEVVSVSYCVADEHFALVVYRPVETIEAATELAAIESAELIIEQSQR
jgi:uncharacterized lipoprotein YehR (DUF1307 family)